MIKPKTQYVVQVHIQNSTDKEETIRAGDQLHVRPSSRGPDGSRVVRTRHVQARDSGAHTRLHVPIACSPNKTMNVFTVFPHIATDRHQARGHRVAGAAKTVAVLHDRSVAVSATSR